ncbi:MAG TPA: Ig-like domain-containing protein, partial [Bacteroidales bacterium]|nr:Ig-like domain-containing protein [Bacteroidales bacterium]
MRKLSIRYRPAAYFFIILFFGLSSRSFSQSGPVITDITDQVISEGEVFTAIDLDKVVSDPDNNPDELMWSFSNNDELQVSIQDHMAMIEIPNTDWYGQETILFTVTDPDSNLSSDEATFTVQPVNDPPVISDIPGQEIPEGESFNDFNLDPYVSDIDDALASLTWSVNDGTNLTATIDGSHNASIKANNTGWTGSETFVFSVQDATGANASDNATFTINNTEDFPVAADDSYSVNEGSNLSTPAPGVLSNDSDADGDPLSAVLVSGPAYSTSFSLNEDGSFSYSHNGNETGEDSFTYHAWDGTGYSNTVTVTITINPLNDPPVVTDIPGQTISEGSTFATIDLNNYVADPDNPNNTIDWTYSGNSLLTVSISAGKIATISIPSTDWFGSETITFKATDPASDWDEDQAVFTVNSENDPPVISDIPNQTILEGASFSTINLDGYVADPDDNDNQITWTIAGNSQLNVTISPSRVATITTPSNDWNGTETITFTATDPASGSDNDPVTFTATNVNDNPVLAGIEGAALVYNEGDAAKQVTASLTVTDIDNTLVSAIVAITGNYQDDQDVLSYPGGFGITASWNSSTGRLTLTGNTNPANYQNALRLVAYHNTSLNPATTARTVTFTVNDGVVTSNQQLRSITINPANSAPVLTDPTVTPVNFTEDAGAVQLTNTITITDDDNTTIAGALVKITTGLVSTEDNLSFVSTGGINGSYNTGSGELNLTGIASLSNYRTVLRSVTYSNSSDVPNTSNRLISFTVTDGSSISNSINKTVTVSAANDPPVLSAIESTAVSYSEGDGAVKITNTITVADIDNSPMTSAIITISNNYQNGQDVLGFTNGFGLTGTWNQSQGMLTLSGTATVAQMQSALRSITYENTSKNPSTAARTVRFAVSDGSSSNTVTRNISLGIVNDPPVLTEPVETTVAFTENGGSVRLTSTLTVTDEDNSSLASGIVSITSGFRNDQDILSFTPATGITGVYNQSSGILTFNGVGTLSTYQTLLRSIRYDNSSEAPDITNRVISFTVNDGTDNSTAVAKTVTITPQNDPPVATNVTITALNNNIGTLHTGSFTYTDPDGDDPGTHTYQWYRSDFSNGTSPVAIPGANAATYRPVRADGGKFIGFEVIPFDKNNLAGSPARTAVFININAVPEARNVRVYAPQSVPGSIISGRFTYFDKESNPRGNAIYFWYRSNVSNPTESSPGTPFDPPTPGDSTYTLSSTDSDKWIWFAVSPVASAGSSPGDTTWSNIIGPIGKYTASLSGSDTVCSGVIMPVTLTITGGKSPYRAVLHRTGILPKDTTLSDIISSPRLINVKIPGTYTIVEVTDAGDDQADITDAKAVTLVVNPRSRARISGSASICQGVDTHAQLTLDFLSGAKPWNVTIRRGETAFNDTILTGLNSDPSTFISRIIGSGPTRHRVVAITDANGCAGDTTSGSAWLSYKTSPIAVISGSDSICPGEPARLSVILTSGTTPWSFSYQRNGVHAGTYANITNTSQTISVTQSGIYTLSAVTDPGGNGCGSGKALIAAHTTPTATISGTATICEHTSANLQVNLTGKSPWKFGYHRNMTFDSTVVENVLTSPRTVQVRKAGTYRLFEVIDRNGCSGTVSGNAVITVTPAPDVTISGLKKAYNYKENEIDTIIGTPAGGEYGGPGVLGNFFLPTIAGLGTHNITYKYRTSPGSCWGYDTAIVNVLESNSIILFENGRTKYCQNDAPFTVTGVNLADNIGFFTISGGAGLVDHGDNTATVYPDRLNPNRYVITYIYYFGGDMFPQDAEFDIGPAPSAHFKWATECYTEGQPINFINTSGSSFGFLTDTSYYWKISTNTGFDSDTLRNISYTFPVEGLYTIELRIVNSYGCSDTAIANFNL